METPRTYYNTITLTDSTRSFIVGLLQEVYDNHAHQPARTRWLLAYQPNIAHLESALPVLHEQLHVLTANDWQQSNQQTLPSMVNDYFQSHDQQAVITYFTTYIPQHPQPPITQLLIGSQWPVQIQHAQQLLKLDLKAFVHHQAPTLKQAPLSFNALGYFVN